MNELGQKVNCFNNYMTTFGEHYLRLQSEIMGFPKWPGLHSLQFQPNVFPRQLMHCPVRLSQGASLQSHGLQVEPIIDGFPKYVGAHL